MLTLERADVFGGSGFGTRNAPPKDQIALLNSFITLLTPGQQDPVFGNMKSPVQDDWFVVGTNSSAWGSGYIGAPTKVVTITRSYFNALNDAANDIGSALFAGDIPSMGAGTDLAARVKAYNAMVGSNSNDAIGAETLGTVAMVRAQMQQLLAKFKALPSTPPSTPPSAPPSTPPSPLTPLYKKPAFWIVVGGVLAVGGATTFALTRRRKA